MHRMAIVLVTSTWYAAEEFQLSLADSSVFFSTVCVFVCVQGTRDTPSARAAQLGPQTLVNLFNSPLYSDVIFMVQGKFTLILLDTPTFTNACNTAEQGHILLPWLN